MDLQKIEEYEKVLEMFADHRNWTNGRFTPVVNGIDEHPADIAGRVLNENK